MGKLSELRARLALFLNLQAMDLLENPLRAPGWVYGDPVIRDRIQVKPEKKNHAR